MSFSLGIIKYNNIDILNHQFWQRTLSITWIWWWCIYPFLVHHWLVMAFMMMMRWNHCWGVPNCTVWWYWAHHWHCHNGRSLQLLGRGGCMYTPTRRVEGSLQHMIQVVKGIYIQTRHSTLKLHYHLFRQYFYIKGDHMYLGSLDMGMGQGAGHG